MALFGLNKEEWAERQSWDGDYPLPEVGIGVHIQISKIEEGLNKDGEEYILFYLDAPAENGETVTFTRYFGKDEKRLPLLKHFIEATGFGHLLTSDEDESVAVMIGAEFKADISHYENKKTGKKNADIVQKTISPLGGVEGGTAPAPKKPTGPRRGGVAR